MALKFFAGQKCDLVIWETGLGGRLDATNIVTPLASVITNIALDHQQWLGDTLEKITAEKAGIIKPGVPVVTATDEPETLGVIETIAREKTRRSLKQDQFSACLHLKKKSQGRARRLSYPAGRTSKNERQAGAGHRRNFAEPNSSQP